MNAEAMSKALEAIQKEAYTLLALHLPDEAVAKLERILSLTTCRFDLPAAADPLPEGAPTPDE
jgi:hypothetical protein